MAIVLTTATPSSALATNGTLVFSYPSIPLSGYRTDPYPFDANHISQNAAPQGLEQTSSGDFAYSYQHRAYASGLQAPLVYGKDFSLSFSDTIATGITMTYLGSTSIPAGTPITLQLHIIGQNNGDVFNEDPRQGRNAMIPTTVVRFGTPLAANTTLVLATTAVADTVLHALTTPVVLDIPRSLQIVSSGSDTAVITIRGLDEYGVAMTESLTLNGTTPVLGKKAWKTVVSYQAGAAMANNLSIGSSVKMGFPMMLGAKAYVISESVDGDVAGTRATIVAADSTVPSATTGDVRGTYQPNTAQNAAHRYEAICITPDPRFLGLAQYAG